MRNDLSKVTRHGPQTVIRFYYIYEIVFTPGDKGDEAQRRFERA